MYFRRFKVDSLQGIMRVTLVFLALSLPLIYSFIARFFTMFFIIELFVVGIWLFSAGRVGEERSWKETRSVDFGRFKKLLKVMWICFGVVQIFFLIYNIFTAENSWSDSLYGWFSVAGKFLSPLLLAVFPFYIKVVEKAGKNASFEIDTERFFIKRKIHNYQIIIALTIVFFLSYVMLFFTVPAIARTAPDYPSVTTHDIRDVYSFKTSGTGEDTLPSLFENLPGRQSLKRAEAKAGEFRVEYDDTEENIDKLIIYNSAAAFALTDKLERIVFVFSEVETVIERESFIEACSDFENILDSDNWYVEIQSKMSYNIDPEEFIERIKK